MRGNAPPNNGANMKALFVTELGAGYGNAAPLVRLAERLVPFKIKPVFAFSDGVTPAWLLRGKDWPILPAPVLREPLKAKAGPATYGDILALSGFADGQELAALVAQWDALFDLVQPRFIVTSHAPTAMLAARGRYPVVAVGTGFTLPPCHMSLFPALRPDTASFRTEHSMLAHVNALLSARRLSPITALPQLLASTIRIVSSTSLLDPYAAHRLEPYYQIAETGLSPAPRPDGGVFAFLDMRGKEAFNAVEALAYLAGDVEVEAHLRGPGAGAALGLLRRRGAVTHESPPNTQDALSRARVVLSQGGHGMSWSTSMSGHGHVIMPIHFESMLNGVALERAGIGRVAWGGAVDTVLKHLNDLLAGPVAPPSNGANCAPPTLEPNRLIDALGLQTQRRGSPAGAKPKRGQKRQASCGAGASAR